MGSKTKKRTDKQIALAQYFTPLSIATYMASLFEDKAEGSKSSRIRILDPGAGEGILGLSVIKKFKNRGNVEATFVEVDAEVVDLLKRRVQQAIKNTGIKASVEQDDFIDLAIGWHAQEQTYTHIIINPPYFKIKADSQSSLKLRQDNINVTNIYAAFLWLSIKLLKPNGELVAIVPRSFCNGPYFLKFREYLLAHCSLEKIHSFASRNKAFSIDGVLQENIIIQLKKRKQTKKIKIIITTDHAFNDQVSAFFDSDKVVEPGDKNKVIHIPPISQVRSRAFKNGLESLGIDVSTGPVVDFRATAFIHKTKPKTNSIPLIYPAHMKGETTKWPLLKINKRGQYLAANEKTLGWAVPLNNYYVIVRRFSSKEEKRRIFASVIGPNTVKASHIAFENHVNFYHIRKGGMDKEVAVGLSAYLNSSAVDKYFRSFSGHTQVNVSDLKRLRYPSNDKLRELGDKLSNIKLGMHTQIAEDFIQRLGNE